MEQQNFRLEIQQQIKECESAVHQQVLRLEMDFYFRWSLNTSCRLEGHQSVLGIEGSQVNMPGERSKLMMFPSRPRSLTV